MGIYTICNCEKNNVDIISKDGKMSPHRMLTTTFSDELKLFNDNSKVIGISLKDRYGWIVRENDYIFILYGFLARLCSRNK